MKSLNPGERVLEVRQSHPTLGMKRGLVTDLAVLKR